MDAKLGTPGPDSPRLAPSPGLSTTVDSIRNAATSVATASPAQILVGRAPPLLSPHSAQWKPASDLMGAAQLLLSKPVACQPGGGLPMLYGGEKRGGEASEWSWDELKLLTFLDGCLV